MARRISAEPEQLMKEFYAQHLRIEDMARRANVSYYTAYRFAKSRQRVNPATGEPLESLNQYQAYRARQKAYRESKARQRVNPATGELFESLYQCEEFRAIKRQERPENQGLSGLIKKRLVREGNSRDASKIRGS